MNPEMNDMQQAIGQALEKMRALQVIFELVAIMSDDSVEDEQKIEKGVDLVVCYGDQRAMEGITR